jgi:hypothetical protein
MQNNLLPGSQNNNQHNSQYGNQHQIDAKAQSGAGSHAPLAQGKNQNKEQGQKPIENVIQERARLKNETKLVRNFTQMSDEQINQMLAWYARQPRMIQLEVFRTQKEVYRKMKKWIGSQYQEHPEAARLAVFVLSIKKTIEILTHDQRKNFDRDLEPLAKSTRLRLEKIRRDYKKKSKPKYRQLKKRFALIEQLRANGCSWSEIAKYLQRYAKLSISESYVRNSYYRLKEEYALEEV